MHINEFKAEYTYDYNLDVINIEVKDEYIHEKSIELAFGVFLDFDENYTPVNLEIISASKIINVEKDLLVNPEGNVTIIIGEDLVNVNVAFIFSNENENISLTALNDFGCPNSQTSFALI